MNAAAYRVALGTLPDAPSLCAALSALRSIPLELDQLCCVGTSDGLGRADRSFLTCVPPPDDGLLAIVRDVVPVIRRQGAPEIMATRNRLLTQLKGPLDETATRTDAGACWLATGDQQDLMRRMQDGTVAIVVTTNSDRAWTASTQTLLRHSSSPVQSYFRPTLMR